MTSIGWVLADKGAGRPINGMHIFFGMLPINMCTGAKLSDESGKKAVALKRRKTE